ncbi:flavodoxin family protein [Isachenkonia alkalipeptolytica]|nr:flavodoxin family protein [Isachenkonia alkalipeptolytica]
MEGKKVLAINSSKRKKNTYGLLQQLKEQLKEKNTEVEILNLFDYDIKECTGCEICLRKGSCILQDQAEELMDKLRGYDGLILSTPVYMGNISGKLKVFVDRTCRWFHRPELIGVPTLFVTTTAASGIKDTFRSLETIGFQWGAFPTDSIARKSKDLNRPVDEKEYKSFLKHLHMPREKYRPSTRQMIHFQVQKVLAEKILAIDKDYWEGQEWLDKNYFYDTKASFISRVTALLVYKILYKRIK